MHKVVVQRDIKVPLHKAWEILDDFGGVYRYHPSVESSPIDNGITFGLGAERVCRLGRSQLTCTFDLDLVPKLGDGSGSLT